MGVGGITPFCCKMSASNCLKHSESSAEEISVKTCWGAPPSYPNKCKKIACSIQISSGGTIHPLWTSCKFTPSPINYLKSPMVFFSPSTTTKKAMLQQALHGVCLNKTWENGKAHVIRKNRYQIKDDSFGLKVCLPLIRQCILFHHYAEVFMKMNITTKGHLSFQQFRNLLFI